MDLNRMDVLEGVILGVLLDFGTKSNFFLIFLQAYHFCYSKVFPDSLIEVRNGPLALMFLFIYRFNIKILVFLIYFALMKATKVFGCKESSLVVSLACAIALNFEIIPANLTLIFIGILGIMIIFSIPTTFSLIIDYIFMIILSVVVYLDTSILVLILENIHFIVYWLLVSVIGLITIFTANYLKISQILQRKLVHFLLLAIYIPGISIPHLTSFLSLMIFNIITVLGLIRQKSPSVNQFFLNITSHKNSEDFIVTHIYLILGFSFPILMSMIFKNKLLAWSGIISLGVGDTFAYLIGYSFGKIHLPYSKKTLEGTLGGFLSMCIFCSYYNLLTPHITLHLLTISFYEAYTQKIDNLVLPILTFILFSLVL